MKRISRLVLFGLLFFVLVFITAGCENMDELSDLTDKAGELIDQATGAIGELSGSEPHGQTSTRGQTIVDYFNGEEVYFYHQYLGETITPVSGNPPASTGTRQYLVNEELFFNDGSEINGDTLTVNISRVNNTEFFAGTTTKSWFDWPQSLTITEKSDGLLVAEGEGNGHVEKSGGDENYVYDYVTYEKWIFTLEKLEDSTTVSVTTESPSSIISAPGWNSGNTASYSQYGITVGASSPHGLRVIPGIKIIRVNGFEITNGLEWQETEINDNTSRYTFTSYYNGEYVVVGGCRTYGKNFALIGETWDDTEFTIIVNDAERELPDYYYPEQ